MKATDAVRRQRRVGLGIDAGGTFTDAVLVDVDASLILAEAKAPTTSEEPINGIRNVLRMLPDGLLEMASFASLATTFATNAIVQGYGARAGLVLIGYDQDHRELSRMSPTLFLRGGHDFWGQQKAPLEMELLEEKLPSLLRNVDALAVSGFFSVRNPDHEKQVVNYIIANSRLPVVEGHKLSSRLDAVRRATTAWWNARLIPLINRLIDDARQVLEERGIRAPLFVVKGDGTLMAAHEARRQPVETILSGPAASILGARFLTRRDDGLVVDMGGTTTDMAFLHKGKVAVDPEGARVGGWNTHVEAARIATTGLGGDSIIFTENGTLAGLRVGPLRVEPFCVAAERFPEILHRLNDFNRAGFRIPLSLYNPCLFYSCRGHDSTAFSRSAPFARGPVSEYDILTNSSSTLRKHDLKRLTAEGEIYPISLTPTDFCVARGDALPGSRKAAQAAISLLASGLGVDEKTLYISVEREIARGICIQAVNLCYGKKAPHLASLMPYWFFGGVDENDEDIPMELSVHLRHPVLAVGAPALAWLPGAFASLHASCALPDHFRVGAAVGAAAGTVGFVLTAEIRTVHDEKFLLFTPVEKREYGDYQEAVRAGRRILEKLARERMLVNNIGNPVLRFAVETRTTPVPDGEMNFCTLLELQATGRFILNAEVSYVDGTELKSAAL